MVVGVVVEDGTEGRKERQGKTKGLICNIEAMNDLFASCSGRVQPSLVAFTYLVVIVTTTAIVKDRDLIVVALNGRHPPSLPPRTSRCSGVVHGAVFL